MYMFLFRAEIYSLCIVKKAGIKGSMEKNELICAARLVSRTLKLLDSFF